MSADTSASSGPADSGAVNGAIRPARIIVLTTVMLSFISAWRAAALVLNDLASTAYYIGGIAEYNIGKAAPWFILFVMLFAYAVRWVYMESCSMFVRGGVYRIVKEALGRNLAKVAVSALVFDFILTGPISGVAAGHYIHDFLLGISRQIGVPFFQESNTFSVVVALGMTAYFWRLNIRGVHESSSRALKILFLTIVMVVLLNVWSVATIAVRGGSLPPFDLTPAENLHEGSLGWLEGIPWVKTIGLAVFFVALGHTLLAMSGEEALAQVYREIEAPKLKNLKKTAAIILAVSIGFTGFTSFTCFMLIPDDVRVAAGDNLLNELVMNLLGPESLKLVMVGFVVLVGALILAGAVNTSIFASNGVLNRVAEDGILPEWFRHPHRRFGTTHRVIHAVALLQAVTIIASHGDVHILGEAYAFGVIWSFAFMSVSMLILRFKYKGERTIRVPLNLRLGRIEIPVGIALVAFVLVSVALVNLFTKKTATISGVSFTAVFFGLFMVTDYLTTRQRRGQAAQSHREKFLLQLSDDFRTVGQAADPADTVKLLVPIRDPNNLSHLKTALQESYDRHTQIVVMTVKVDQTYREGASYNRELEASGLYTEARGQALDDHDEYLFTRVVELAESYGEQVTPLIVPSNNPWYAIAKTAYELGVDEIYLGLSGRVPAEIQVQQLVILWTMLSDQAHRRVTLRIIDSTGKEIRQEL